MFDKEVLKPILDSIANYGSRNAFCINEQYYTYSKLAEAISRACMALEREKPIGKNIGLVANDDLETYASIFAIWLEGFAYVPLHPQQPIGRSFEIINQAEVSLLLDSNAKMIFPSIKTISNYNIEPADVNLQPKSISEDSLAYILFTSGSTGIPKGVPITRKNVGAFMKSFWNTGIHINEYDKCLQCFDLTFDVSVQSYLVPLTKGACVYTIPHNQIKFSYVYGLLEDHKLTFGAMAPSMIRYLRPYFDEINTPSMRYCILTAEASSIDLVIEWAHCIPNAEILNFYGPTEATIYCTYHKFNRGKNNKQLNGMLSIGKPMPGLSAIIVDEEGNPLGTNQKGELCISGDQITPGYWKNPEKNKESFFDFYFNGESTRFYKTGDSCYFDNDGDIMLLGRLDYQVKIQGYRIELGEIEYHAREFLEGLNAVAIPFFNLYGNTEIALFIEGPTPDTKKLIANLSNKIPLYMVPTKILSIDQFPLNANGKIDRIKIKEYLKAEDSMRIN